MQDAGICKVGCPMPPLPPLPKHTTVIITSAPITPTTTL